jgi:hypothetical protein
VELDHLGELVDEQAEVRNIPTTSARIAPACPDEPKSAIGLAKWRRFDVSSTAATAARPARS